MKHIVAENVYKIFGSNKKAALKLLKQGKTKEEILKKTGCTVAVNNANFSIEKGEIFVIMGLSGSGKSTLLRCINRLHEPTEGKITLVDGDEEKDVKSMDHEELREIRRHKMSMVFQHFGLLPHRTARSNVAFGLEIQGIKEEERLKKADEVIETVGLKGYGHQMTGQLSGGMRQRVGLARALATDPDILLMDEAFSALDPLIKTNMQDELIQLQEKVRKTILFITHDLDEALKIGDRIAIMKDGKIVQIGTPEEILMNPENAYVEAFVENVFRGKIITASSLMFKQPSRLILKKHGPRYALRIMGEIGVNILPVTDSEKRFIGFVKDDDLSEVVEKGEKEITNAVIKDVSTASPDTPAKDLLALFIDTDTPVAVIDEEKRFLGVVIHSSVVAQIMGLEEERVEEISQQGELL